MYPIIFGYKCDLNGQIGHSPTIYTTRFYFIPYLGEILTDLIVFMVKMTTD
jgi:hypothetical protein